MKDVFKYINMVFILMVFISCSDVESKENSLSVWNDEKKYKYSDVFVKKMGLEGQNEGLYFPVKEEYALKIFLAIPNDKTISYFYFEKTDYDDTKVDFSALARLEDIETIEILNKRIAVMVGYKQNGEEMAKYCKIEPERYYFMLRPEGAIQAINLDSVKDDLKYIQDYF